MSRLGAAPASGAHKAICFHLAGQQLGVPIALVKETIVLRPITRVFLTPPWVAGLVNLRGDVVAVLDLAALMGLPPTSFSDETRIVIVRHDGKSAGLLCDRLAESRDYLPAQLESPPPTLAPEAAELLAGVVTLEQGEPLLVLDLDKLMSSERTKQFSRRS